MLSLVSQVKHHHFMEYRYPANDHSIYASYHRTQHGPDGILVYYKHRSSFVFSPKELRSVFGPAKFTPSVKALSDWSQEMFDKYTKEEHEEEGMSPQAATRVDTSFASEAMVI